MAVPLPQTGARRPGPRPRLSREMIVEAALRIGPDRFTMSELAAALDAAPASLYRHVTGRHDVVVAALRHVLESLPPPVLDRGWRPTLHTEARLRWPLLTRLGGLIAEHEAELVEIGVDRMEALVGSLVAAGFPVDDAVLAVDTVLDIVHDGAAHAARLRGAGSLAAAFDRTLTRCSPPTRAALERIAADPWAHVERKLEIVLDGIASRHAPRGPGV